MCVAHPQIVRSKDMPSKKSNETQEEELEQQQSQSENDLALRTPDEHLEMLAAARQMKQSVRLRRNV